MWLTTTAFRGDWVLALLQNFNFRIIVTDIRQKTNNAMKKILIVTVISSILPSLAQAESLQSAKVTTKINDVRIYQTKQSGRQAKVGDTVSGHTSVQTGRRSRAELTFQDKTLTRIGANSTFSFRQGSRDINLNSGSILLQVPKNSGGATIRTATITAAITGTTILAEYNTGNWIKFITLEGTIYLNLNTQKNIFGKPKKVKVPAGSMCIIRPGGEFINKPVDVDIKLLLKTSLLAGTKQFGKLPPEAQNEINKAIAKQDLLKSKGILLNQNSITRLTCSGATMHQNIQRDVYQKPMVIDNMTPPIDNDHDHDNNDNDHHHKGHGYGHDHD